MDRSLKSNFGARLFRSLSDKSDLIDAATGEVILAADLPDRIKSCAAGFRTAGLVPSDRVVIACDVSPASTLAYLGALYAGLTVVPINERTLSTSGEAVFRVTRARALWSQSPCEWARLHNVLQIHSHCQSAQAHGLEPAPRRENDLAALMPTSGSTGTPRLVQVTHGNLIANTEAIIRSQRLFTDERALLILPINYCFGASVMHTHLYQGGGVVYDSRFMFADKVLHSVERYGCTTFAGVPAVYNILLRRSNLRSIPLTPLRRFLQAGGALASARIREMREAVPHAEFYAMYGQTEATSRIACLPPDRLEEKLGSVGLPLDNLMVRIADESGKDLPDGHTGEILVRGKSICCGYYEDPDETERKFHDGWLATGDLAWRDRDGFLWITGRKSEFVKMRGIRLGLAEIETRVESTNGVCECAAQIVEHAEAGEAVALYVVAEEGAHSHGVAAAIRRNVPSEWIIASITLVAELPRNAHGKLQRSQLSSALRRQPVSLQA
jgi:acyl-CoA synthetase (AMP-forming)/AMP-acid ligase II